MNQQDIVITGIGMLTASGLGLEVNNQLFDQESRRTTQEDFKVKDFNPAPHLTDRKVVKVVSHRDVLGLVAFEECLKTSGLSAKVINPDRTGLYVGAPPSSCIDHHNYNEGIEAAVDSYGQLQERMFGETFRTANPTTLLTGLPNNVLCYGAKTLDARGPNSNYTTLETSSHMAVIGAVRAMRLGRVDCAIAGGYTAHSDQVFASAMTQRGVKTNTPIAEGAAFATLETRKNAESRGATILCQVLSCGAASDAKGPYKRNQEAPALSELIRQNIARAQIQANEIEVILTTGCGIKEIDDLELQTINDLWPSDYKPILATTSTRWGNLMEAGGVADIGFLAHAFKTGQLPASAQLSSQRPLNRANKTALILRTSPWGEYSCLIVRMSPTQDEVTTA